MVLKDILTNRNYRMNNNYAILVNTCDDYEDCWNPFFTLLEKYWPKCNAPIYLNTENKIWQHPRLDIRCTTVQKNAPNRLAWSKQLIAALDQIENPVVLYFQEDYFIHQNVRSELIELAVQYMLDHPEVKHIALTRHGTIGPHEHYKADWVKKIKQKARYRISTQAALWRVDTLKSYLCPEENPWMFEIYGTWRAHRRQECFLCAAFDDLHGGPAIDYLHTGIIKGKWLPEIQQVFQSNGIYIEYEKRGFYTPEHPFLRKLKLARRLLNSPGYLLKQFL